jgi:acetyl esterase/lipase
MSSSLALPTLDALLFHDGFAAALALAGNAQAHLSGHRRLRDLAYGPRESHRLDLYIPRRFVHPAPIVLFIYGGNWQMGSKKLYPFLAHTFTAAGYLVAIPDYRKYPEVRFPEFMHDIAAATAWLKQHVPQYGGNPAQLSLMGHSAGAQMALLLACDNRYLAAEGIHKCQLASVSGIAGPYAFTPCEDVYGDIFGLPPHCEPMHAHRHLDGSEPPTLLLHGRRDHLVPVANSRKLYREMRRAGSSVEIKLYDRMGHLDILARASRKLGREGIVARDLLGFLADKRSAAVALDTLDHRLGAQIGEDIIEVA